MMCTCFCRDSYPRSTHIYPSACLRTILCWLRFVCAQITCGVRISDCCQKISVIFNHSGGFWRTTHVYLIWLLCSSSWFPNIQSKWFYQAKMTCFATIKKRRTSISREEYFQTNKIKWTWQTRETLLFVDTLIECYSQGTSCAFFYLKFSLKHSRKLPSDAIFHHAHTRQTTLPLRQLNQ